MREISYKDKRKILWFSPVLHPDNTLWQVGLDGRTIILRKVPKKRKKEHNKIEVDNERA